MMHDAHVIRQIPERAWSGLADGSLLLKPGAIYHKHGGIFAHFLASSPEGVQQAAASITGPPGAFSSIQQMMGQLTTLAQASVVLSGVNLAVTAAGFAVVCQKLNQMNATLDGIRERLDVLLIGQARLEWRQEMERTARVQASLENLAMGLRIGREGMAEDAISRLTESAAVYRQLCEFLLKQPRQIYLDPQPMSESLRFLLGCDFAKAQALAHLGHASEAMLVVSRLRDWHDEQYPRLNQPLQKKPVYLGQLTSAQRSASADLVQAQRKVPVAIDYAHTQYQTCDQLSTKLGDLVQLQQDRPFALILLEAA